MTTHARTDADPASQFDVGASGQAAARNRTAIQHEIARLFDELAPLAVPGRRAPTVTAVTTHRWPNRCILQAESCAVSLTWFAGTRGDESLGELLVMTWRGRVTLPGSGQRTSDPAAAVIAQRTLHPAWTLASGWGWRAAGEEGDDAVQTTDALVAACRQSLEDGDGDGVADGEAAERARKRAAR